MRYLDFQQVLSASRMNRYLSACGGNTRKAMTLYRKNLLLTQELFTVIGCFEVALRNAIDQKAISIKGHDWLRDGAAPGGCFDHSGCAYTRDNIHEAIRKLHHYNHQKLVAELGFGFWRFMFAHHQYNATGRILLNIFPAKPKSSPLIQYNANYIFKQLADLNELRNRMAHHEPVCFVPKAAVKSTEYARRHYRLVLQLFQWMLIDEVRLLYGLDHISRVCDEIDNL